MVQTLRREEISAMFDAAKWEEFHVLETQLNKNNLNICRHFLYNSCLRTLML